jgi:hypothetical protein
MSISGNLDREIPDSTVKNRDTGKDEFTETENSSL